MYVPKWLISILLVICLVAGLSAVWVYANSAFWWVVGGLVVAAGITAVVYTVLVYFAARIMTDLIVEFFDALSRRR